MMYFVFFLLLFFFSSPLHAQNSYMEFERGLNLTDSQKAQTEEIKKKYMDDWRSLRRESMKKRIELREAYRNPQNNGGKAETLQNDLRNIEQSRENLYNQYRSEVGRVLTPEQREKFNNFNKEERRKGMRPFQMRGYGR